MAGPTGKGRNGVSQPALPLSQQLKRSQQRNVFLVQKHLAIRDMVKVAIENQTGIVRISDNKVVPIGTIDPTEALKAVLAELDKGDPNAV